MSRSHFISPEDFASKVREVFAQFGEVPTAAELTRYYGKDESLPTATAPLVQQQGKAILISQNSFVSNASVASNAFSNALRQKNLINLDWNLFFHRLPDILFVAQNYSAGQELDDLLSDKLFHVVDSKILQTPANKLVIGAYTVSHLFTLLNDASQAQHPHAEIYLRLIGNFVTSYLFNPSQGEFFYDFVFRDFPQLLQHVGKIDSAAAPLIVRYLAECEMQNDSTPDDNFRQFAQRDFLVELGKINPRLNFLGYFPEEKTLESLEGEVRDLAKRRDKGEGDELIPTNFFNNLLAVEPQNVSRAQRYAVLKFGLLSAIAASFEQEIEIIRYALEQLSWNEDSELKQHLISGIIAENLLRDLSSDLKAEQKLDLLFYQMPEMLKFADSKQGFFDIDITNVEKFLRDKISQNDITPLKNILTHGSDYLKSKAANMQISLLDEAVKDFFAPSDRFTYAGMEIAQIFPPEIFSDLSEIGRVDEKYDAHYKLLKDVLNFVIDQKTDHKPEVLAYATSQLEKVANQDFAQEMLSKIAADFFKKPPSPVPQHSETSRVLNLLKQGLPPM